MEETQIGQLATMRSRILAMVYDGLIILFFTTVVVLLIQLVLIGDNQIQPDHILNKILKPFWFVPGFLYLGYYWTKNGQTPSMKIWKIKLVNQQGKTINWLQAFTRYITALLGFGIVWAIFNKKRFGIQDILSNTFIVKTTN